MRNNKLFVYILSILLMLSCTPHDRYMVFSGYAQGGTYTVKLNLKGVKEDPQAIRDSVDALLVKIDNSLSGYNKNSLLSRFNAGQTIVPDSLFIDIYARAHDFYEQTGMVVDAASAPLFDIWGFGFKSGAMPDDDAVKKTMLSCGLKRLCRDMNDAMGQGRSVSGKSMLLSDGALPKLNYNAIAQGYSCDVVARYLYSLGVKDMMVDIGEIFCDGKNPSGMPWTLGIDRPVDGNNDPGAQMQGIFKVPDGPHGVVTSGNYRKFYVRDGRKYAHSIDPRTGYPVEHNLLSATIVAPDATSADAYATYCMVIGLEQAIEFISSREDLEGCLVYDEGGVFRTWCSEGLVLSDPTL